MFLRPLTQEKINWTDLSENPLASTQTSDTTSHDHSHPLHAGVKPCFNKPAASPSVNMRFYLDLNVDERDLAFHYLFGLRNLCCGQEILVW